jgi:hypothetical protein
MEKEDYRELWQERLRLELIWHGKRIPRTEQEAENARIVCGRVSEILQQIPQEIQEQFLAEMKENYKQFMEARAEGMPT